MCLQCLPQVPASVSGVFLKECQPSSPPPPSPPPRPGPCPPPPPPRPPPSASCVRLSSVRLLLHLLQRPPASSSGVLANSTRFHPWQSHGLTMVSTQFRLPFCRSPDSATGLSYRAGISTTRICRSSAVRPILPYSATLISYCGCMSSTPVYRSTLFCRRSATLLLFHPGLSVLLPLDLVLSTPLCRLPQFCRRRLGSSTRFCCHSAFFFVRRSGTPKNRAATACRAPFVPRKRRWNGATRPH